MSFAPNAEAAGHHKWTYRIWNPASGQWKYHYPASHDVRIPNPIERAKDIFAEAGGKKTTGGPLGAGALSPQAASPAGERPDPDADRHPMQRRLIDRVERGGQAGDGDLERFVSHARVAIHHALLLYLHEHCLMGNATDAWRAIQPHLQAALDAGMRASLADHRRVHQLFKWARGNETLAAHLIAADRWTEIAHAMAAAARVPHYGGEIAHANAATRLPAFDSARATLRELEREQG